MRPTQFSPCEELRERLLPAYAPCTNFGGACAGVARWCPGKGHVPRGFLGALGSLDEVQFVLVVAEPGKPLPGETYEGRDPADYLDRCAEKVYRIFERSHAPFHSNIRWILDECFPGLCFSQQMRRTWITEAYLCSLRPGKKNAPARSWEKCAENYLLPQLQLLKDRKIVALGGKAQSRVRALRRLRGFDCRFREALHPSVRPLDLPRARESWKKIPPYLHGSDHTPRPP
jgi:hypothetical protein